MWNIIYENHWLKWYTYPFLYGIAGALFMAASLLLARMRSVPLRPRRVLDFSFLFLCVYIILSKWGDLIYNKASNSLDAPFNLAVGGRATHIAVFAIAILSVLANKTHWKINKLWPCWAGPFLLAITVGYVGCFCYGCCYGREVCGDYYPFGVRFPVRHNQQGQIIGSPAAVEQMKDKKLGLHADRSLPVYPTQLFYVGLYGISGILVSIMALKRPRPDLFLLAIWLYFGVRVVVDPYRSYAGDMKIYSFSPLIRLIFFCVISAMLGIRVLFKLRERLTDDSRISPKQN